MRAGTKVLGILAIAGFAAVSTLFLLNHKIDLGNDFMNVSKGDIDSQFINFMGKFKKSYGTKEEFLFRKQNFAKNY